MRCGCLIQPRNGRYAVAAAGRVIEPGTKCCLHGRQRQDNNTIDNIRGYVELQKLHRRGTTVGSTESEGTSKF